MSNAIDKLADSTILQQVGVLKQAAATDVEILNILQDLDSRIFQLIQKGPTQYSTARLQLLQRQIREAIDETSEDLWDISRNSLEEVAEFAQISSASALNDVFEVDLVTPIVDKRKIDAIISGGAASGFIGADVYFSEKWPIDAYQSYHRIITEGVLLGEAKGALVKRLMDDPLLNLPKHHARTWVRTSMASVANEARMEFWKENEDLADGIEWLSTLDARTSDICKSLDGKQWDWEYNPIGHNKQYPGSIAHFRCRSTQIPILKSWEELAGNKELGKHLDDISEDVRASLDGEVPGKLTYEDWLARQSEQIQRAALGNRYELWRSGSLGIDDLVNSLNEPLTLRELVEKVGVLPTSEKLILDANSLKQQAAKAQALANQLTREAKALRAKVRAGKASIAERTTVSQLEKDALEARKRARVVKKAAAAAKRGAPPLSEEEIEQLLGKKIVPPPIKKPTFWDFDAKDRREILRLRELGKSDDEIFAMLLNPLRKATKPLVRETLVLARGKAKFKDAVSDILDKFESVPKLTKRTEAVRKFLREHNIGTVFYDKGTASSPATRHAIRDWMKSTKERVSEKTMGQMWMSDAQSVGGFTGPHIDWIAVKLYGDDILTFNVNRLVKDIEKHIQTLRKFPLGPGSAGTRTIGHSANYAYEPLSWVHELGHQIHFKAGAWKYRGFKDLAYENIHEWGGVSPYSYVTDYEYAAESFVAWFFDREGLLEVRPSIAKLIDEMIGFTP